MKEQNLEALAPLALKSKHVVKARYGSAFRVARGEYLKAINFHGTQAADVWAELSRMAIGVPVPEMSMIGLVPVETV